MRYLFLCLIMLTTLGCNGDEVDSPRVGVVGNEGDTGHYSEHHIDGWLTDYECVADLERVNDVLVFGRLIQGYTGKGITADQSGLVRLKTIEEVGLSDNEQVRFLPNDKWTSVISESDWVDLKAYIENKLT